MTEGGVALRVVFMGTPAFAVPSLEALAHAHEVVLVVTRPDRTAGRGAHLRESPVKAAALRLDLDVAQPETLAEEHARRIAALRPDVVCVVAFGAILRPDILAIPRLGCVNVHASLLPRHRGAAPIQRAVLEGDAETGVSIMLMEEGLDVGPYALQRRVPVDERYVEELEPELAAIGADALLEVLDDMAAGTVQWTAQDDSRATYAKKVTKADVALNPTLTCDEAFRRVRAATRSAPARMRVDESDLTVVRAAGSAEAPPPGAISFARGVPVIGFREGALALDVVRPAGRSDMPGSAWARGARLGPDSRWSGVL